MVVVVGHRRGVVGEGGSVPPNLASTYENVFIVTQLFFFAQRELTLQIDAVVLAGGEGRAIEFGCSRLSGSTRCAYV